MTKEENNGEPHYMNDHHSYERMKWLTNERLLDRRRKQIDKLEKVAYASWWFVCGAGLVLTICLVMK